MCAVLCCAVQSTVLYTLGALAYFYGISHCFAYFPFHTFIHFIQLAVGCVLWIRSFGFSINRNGNEPGRDWVTGEVNRENRINTWLWIRVCVCLHSKVGPFLYVDTDALYCMLNYCRVCHAAILICSNFIKSQMGFFVFYNSFVQQISAISNWMQPTNPWNQKRLAKWR